MKSHLNRGSLTSRDGGCIDRPNFSREPNRFGPFTAAPLFSIQCSTLTLGFRSESLHHERGFESYLHHPIATSLTYEGQLVVLGQAVTRGSTPKATLLEPTLFRRFFTSSLLTESYGESVASGVWVNG